MWVLHNKHEVTPLYLRFSLHCRLHHLRHKQQQQQQQLQLHDVCRRDNSQCKLMMMIYSKNSIDEFLFRLMNPNNFIHQPTISEPPNMCPWHITHDENEPNYHNTPLLLLIVLLPRMQDQMWQVPRRRGRRWWTPPPTHYLRPRHMGKMNRRERLQRLPFMHLCLLLLLLPLLITPLLQVIVLLQLWIYATRRVERQTRSETEAITDFQMMRKTKRLNTNKTPMPWRWSCRMPLPSCKLVSDDTNTVPDLVHRSICSLSHPRCTREAATLHHAWVRLWRTTFTAEAYVWWPTHTVIWHWPGNRYLEPPCATAPWHVDAALTHSSLVPLWKPMNSSLHNLQPRPRLVHTSQCTTHVMPRRRWTGCERVLPMSTPPSWKDLGNKLPRHVGWSFME